VGRQKSSVPRGARSKEWKRRNDAAAKRRRKQPEVDPMDELDEVDEVAP
jgi:hypothetical protein